jgi:carbohydrate-selective porin OprB
MALPVLEALIRKHAPERLSPHARADLRKLLLSAALLVGFTSSVSAQTQPDTDATSSAIAGNPGAVNIVAGTGELGRLLGLEPDSGLRLGGVLVSNGNYLISGGNAPGTTSFNNLLLTDLDADLDKLAHIPGASFGAALLRFDGQPTNQQAGVMIGYNGLPGAPRWTGRNSTNSGGGNPSSPMHWWCGSERPFRHTISATSSGRFRCRICRCGFLR